MSSAQRTSELGRQLACFLGVESPETLVPRRGPPLVWPGGRTEGGAEIYLKSELGGHLPRLVYLRPLSVEWLGV